MKQYSRRTFLATSALATLGLQTGLSHLVKGAKDPVVMTVNGPVAPSQMGRSLIHEHILVDFIGAAETGPQRWDKELVAQRVLPYLQALKKAGCQTFMDCTPAYIGRDPLLLQMLSKSSGLNILTNTGYYGAADNKFLPQHAHQETAAQLAARWIQEWKKGIDGTGIRPGFIKIGVNPGSLSPLHRKLVEAAILTHKKTGLLICSHTGMAIPAFEQLAMIQLGGVDASAFVWVHAQNEKDLDRHVSAAQQGAWVSLDGLNDENTDQYISLLTNMKQANKLDRVLVSHDAGWYSPGEENGGNYRHHLTLFEKLLPALKQKGFTEAEIRQLLIANPAEAFAIRVRE